MRREDISYRDGYATVKIKVPWQPLEASIREARTDEDLPAGLTEEWIRGNISDDHLDQVFWAVCEAEYEYFTEWSAEILPGTTFHQDGRQGGWAVSNHSEYDVDGWDAVQLAKWGKIERVARQIAAGVNAQIIHSIAINEYVPYAEAVYVDAAPVGEALAALR